MPLNQFLTQLVHYLLKVNDNGVIIGEATFQIGEDKVADALGDAIKALTYDLDKAFDADHGEILDKIKNIIDEQKFADESSENYIQGLSSFMLLIMKLVMMVS
jgi:high-affinity nickel permease